MKRYIPLHLITHKKGCTRFVHITSLFLSQHFTTIFTNPWNNLFSDIVFILVTHTNHPHGNINIFWKIQMKISQLKNFLPLRLPLEKNKLTFIEFLLNMKLLHKSLCCLIFTICYKMGTIEILTLEETRGWRFLCRTGRLLFIIYAGQVSGAHILNTQ